MTDQTESDKQISRGSNQKASRANLKFLGSQEEH